MADLNNLLPGDLVLWLLKNEIVRAFVLKKSDTLVLIQVNRESGDFQRWVSPKVLRLLRGGKKKLQRAAEERQAAIDFAQAYSVGPQRLREVFEREKAAGRINFDYSEMEARVIAYQQQFPEAKRIERQELKGKNTWTNEK